MSEYAKYGELVSKVEDLAKEYDYPYENLFSNLVSLAHSAFLYKHKEHKDGSKLYEEVKNCIKDKDLLNELLELTKTSHSLLCDLFEEDWRKSDVRGSLSNCNRQ